MSKKIGLLIIAVTIALPALCLSRGRTNDWYIYSNKARVHSNFEPIITREGPGDHWLITFKQ